MKSEYDQMHKNCLFALAGMLDLLDHLSLKTPKKYFPHHTYVAKFVSFKKWVNGDD